MDKYIYIYSLCTESHTNCMYICVYHMHIYMHICIYKTTSICVCCLGPLVTSVVAGLALEVLSMNARCPSTITIQKLRTHSSIA